MSYVNMTSLTRQGNVVLVGKNNHNSFHFPVTNTLNHILYAVIYDNFDRMFGETAPSVHDNDLIIY